MEEEWNNVNSTGSAYYRYQKCHTGYKPYCWGLDIRFRYSYCGKTVSSTEKRLYALCESDGLKIRTITYTRVCSVSMKSEIKNCQVKRKRNEMRLKGDVFQLVRFSLVSDSLLLSKIFAQLWKQNDISIKKKKTNGYCVRKS